MSLYGLLKIKQEPSLHDIEDAFDGNLCRCTGNWAYNKIINIYIRFYEDSVVIRSKFFKIWTELKRNKI